MVNALTDSTASGWILVGATFHEAGSGRGITADDVSSWTFPSPSRICGKCPACVVCKKVETHIADPDNQGQKMPEEIFMKLVQHHPRRFCKEARRFVTKVFRKAQAN